MVRSIFDGVAPGTAPQAEVYDTTVVEVDHNLE